MKWIGFLMIMTGCAGIGFSYINEYTRRIEALTQIRDMMHYVQEMITQERLPLFEAVQRSGQRMEGAYRTFLLEVARQMELFSGEDIALIWHKQAEGMQRLIARQDYQDFVHCMDQTGFATADAQGTAICRYESQLSEKINLLSRQKEEKCKLYRSLGILSGIFICVLLF